MVTRSQHEDPVSRLSRVDTAALPHDGGEQYNRLIFQKSPYLLQHAENPVDWYPWGEDAFAAAMKEDKPVFLSIGYSTCHWCHVMAHESFEDDDIAKILNRDFICIKVDREERPDIDNTYMLVCQMMTGAGGWPLNLILAPDRKPFFASTYLPRQTRMGQVGLDALLTKVAELWTSDRTRLLETAEEASNALLSLDQASEHKTKINSDLLIQASQNYQESFDRNHAGFGTPKFPTPHNLSLLLRIWKRTGDEASRDMAIQTLSKIRLGGIFDQIGGGLHRYAVDAGWLVPHFEKMLYDQALASMAFLEAFQATGEAFYAEAALEILTYVERDLSHVEGGYYCGEDADSEGSEGTFYIWTPEQVHEVLGEDLGRMFCRCYGVTSAGHIDGKSVPHLEETIDSLAQWYQISPEELSARLHDAGRQLFTAREGRVRPHRDDKVLTGWNGLIIAALSRGGAVLGEESFVRSAGRAVGFIMKQLRDANGRLLRRFRQGSSVIPAFLEDYAFLCWGLIELYLVRFDSRNLVLALELTDQMDDLFSDGHGGYFDTGVDAETVLTRGRALQDGAIPSGHSVAALNLLRLARLSGNQGLEEKGVALIESCLHQVERHPAAYAQMLIALDFALGPKSEVVLTPGKDGRIPDEWLSEIRSRFLPRTSVLLHRPDKADGEFNPPLFHGKEGGDSPAAFFCRDQTCQAPVMTTEDLCRLLDGL